MRKICLIMVSSFALVPALATVVLGQQRASIPRTADGHPDFTGVWAGPGFTHRGGPGDTDTPRVSNFDPTNFAPFKPGGEALFIQKPTGDVLHDDPTATYILPSQLGWLPSHVSHRSNWSKFFGAAVGERFLSE